MLDYVEPIAPALTNLSGKSLLLAADPRQPSDDGQPDGFIFQVQRSGYPQLGR